MSFRTEINLNVHLHAFAFCLSDIIFSRCLCRVHELAERSNMAFMGTMVRVGRARGVVTAISTSTEFGHVFNMLQVRSLYVFVLLFLEVFLSAAAPSRMCAY
jgi:magnesium-transporting ATPase (P-type)